MNSVKKIQALFFVVIMGLLSLKGVVFAGENTIVPFDVYVSSDKNSEANPAYKPLKLDGTVEDRDQYQIYKSIVGKNQHQDWLKKDSYLVSMEQQERGRDVIYFTATRATTYTNAQGELCVCDAGSFLVGIGRCVAIYLKNFFDKNSVKRLTLPIFFDRQYNDCTIQSIKFFDSFVKSLDKDIKEESRIKSQNGHQGKDSSVNRSMYQEICDKKIFFLGSLAAGFCVGILVYFIKALAQNIK